MSTPPPKTENKVRIWIIILNWNGLDDTLDCLDSLSRIDRAGLEIFILVMDNNSQTDPCPTIKERFPDVFAIRLTENRGFAGGCNYGIQIALEHNADYILLLNNDTIVHTLFLKKLAEYIEHHPSVGIIAPLICYADNPNRVWFAGAKIILALGYFQHRHLNRLIQQIPQTTTRSDYVTGCCILIRTSIIHSTGMLDERFFAYFEDVDFCIRARKRGFDIVVLPQSVIWHKESASTRRGLNEGMTSPLKHYLSSRNRIITILRHANAMEKVFFFLIPINIYVSYYLSAFTLRRRWKKMVWFIRGIIDGIQQRYDHPIM